MDKKFPGLPLDTIIFRRALAFLRAGNERLGALGALMLEQAIVWQKETREDWVKKSMEEWKRETAMTDGEIREARRRLRATPFWAENETENASRLLVRVDWEALKAALERVCLVCLDEESA